MSKKSAIVFMVFVVAIIAFCLGSIFSAITGPISIDFENNETYVTNNTTSNDTDTVEVSNHSPAIPLDDYSQVPTQQRSSEPDSVDVYTSNNIKEETPSNDKPNDISDKENTSSVLYFTNFF